MSRVSGLVFLMLCHSCTASDKVSLNPPAKENLESKTELEKKADPPPSQALAMNENPKNPGSYDGVQMGSGMIQPGETKKEKEIETRIVGEVSAIRNSKIAFRAVGFIDSVAVKPGAIMKKGDVLASLDNRDFVLRVQLAKAKRELAKVNMDSAHRELVREEQLKKAKASTPSAYDKIKATYDSAALGFKLAEIELAVAELALSDTKLQAPYDCVVANQMKYEGENVPAGTAVFEVTDTADPEISLTAPERLMGALRIGAQITVNIPSAPYSGKAEVIRIVPVVSEKTRTFQVTAKLLESNTKVLPGSYVEAILN